MNKHILIQILSLESHEVPKERKEIIKPLMDYIQERVVDNKPIQLHFICTHNSRRSQFAQLWAQTLASYFNIPQVYCFSGGTEATAVYPTVIKTAESIGFTIEKEIVESNPQYLLNYAKEAKPISLFSKKIETSPNPQNNFAAILTCSSADNACPFVPGADLRIPWTFEDPKAFDNTPLETKMYAERSMQIAGELYYLFSNIQKHNE